MITEYRKGRGRPDVVRSPASSGNLLRYGIRLHVTDGPVLAFVVLAILLLVHNHFQSVFSSFGLLLIANATATLALASLGQTLVVMTGGFDLSAAAAVALVNVFVALHLNGSGGHDTGVVALGLAIGVGVGLFNGFCVAFLRLQPIIVTIAAGFILAGLALIVTNQPAGIVPSGYVNLFTGTVGWLPNSLILVAGAAVFWLVLPRMRLGTDMLAIGSDPDSAYISGVPVRTVLLITYGLAGLFYALAGLFLTGQAATGDPQVRTTFLLETFLAVVIGGTRFGGGYASGIGTILGAFIITLIDSVLFDFGVNSFYTQIVEGIVIALAVLLSGLAQRARAKRLVRPNVPEV